MQKIKSLFERNYEGDRLVFDKVVPGSEWVINGEGVATVKFDGTCCMIKGGEFFKRYDAKNGKTPPPGFIPAQDPDPVTGHWPGWVKVTESKEDRWFNEGLRNSIIGIGCEPLDEGTYELVGPKVNGNKQNQSYHYLYKHGSATLGEVPRTFEGLREFFEHANMEGIVWHHPDGRMVKIKKRDFGFKW